MKIGPSPEQTSTPTVSPAAKPASEAAKVVVPSPAVVVEEGAKIELSSTASTLISGGVGTEFDAEKVARISAAIDNGSFKINPEAIADKLIANAQELLNPPKA